MFSRMPAARPIFAQQTFVQQVDNAQVSEVLTFTYKIHRFYVYDIL